MKKTTVLILLVLVLVLAILPVNAMIGGDLDTEHTNVGALVFRWPEHSLDLGRMCSGTLIDPQVLLTAAHCTEPLFENDLVYDNVWVTFEQDALFGDPAQDTEYLEIEMIVEHVDHDIALIMLLEPVQGITPEELPSEGYLDQVIDKSPPGNGRGELDLIFVGYGGTENFGLPDNLYVNAVRKVGTTTLANITPWEILTGNGDSGEASICDGDSGGPLFHVIGQGKEIMVGLHSRSSTDQISCDSIGFAFKYRLDTASALEFINSNLP